MGFFGEVFRRPPVATDREKTQEFTMEQLEALRLKEKRRKELEEDTKDLASRPMGFEPRDGQKPLPPKDYTNYR